MDTETAAYLETLTDKERRAMKIAEDHLGTSFNLKRSNGFVKFKEKWKPVVGVTPAVPELPPAPATSPVTAVPPAPPTEPPILIKKTIVRRKKLPPA